jgi:hypothetical protein
LNEIGARALRIQLGRVLEMAESSPDKFVYENKAAERLGGQKELELVVRTPSGIPSPETKSSPLSLNRSINERGRQLRRP